MTTTKIQTSHMDFSSARSSLRRKFTYRSSHSQVRVEQRIQGWLSVLQTTNRNLGRKELYFTQAASADPNQLSQIV